MSKDDQATLDIPDALKQRSGSSVPTSKTWLMRPAKQQSDAAPGQNGFDDLGDGQTPKLPRNTMVKVSRVLLPICFLAGVLNYLDRTNLNFAALQLNSDLGFTPQDYGLGAGFFSLGYGVAHVPSTYMTMRYGARWWYSSITVAWGIVATCAAFIHTRTGLFVQRFLLGITEAGAIPSALHLIAQFYPRKMLTKPFTAVMLANVLSVVVAAPLAAGLMSLDGVAGLQGWQWLFIVEGVPSVLLGLVMMVLVPSHPTTAWMLTPVERELLHLKVHGSPEAAAAALQPICWSQFFGLVWDASKKLILWFLAFTGFLWVLCVFSLNSWMAIIIKNMLAGTALSGSSSSGGTSQVNTLHATLLSAIPYFVAGIAMWTNAWSSSRMNERTLHVGIPCVVGGILLACFAPLYRAAFAAGFTVIVIALACAYSGQGVMFARVTHSLDVKHAGVGLAIFNAVGAAIGGFSGPWIVGAFVQRLGSFVQAMIFMGMFLLAAGILVTILGLWEQLQKRKEKTKEEKLEDLRAASKLSDAGTADV